MEPYYKSGHVQGAVNIPPDNVEIVLNSIEGLLERASSVIVYCNGYLCGSSKTLADLIGKKYNPNVLIYSGGWPEWKSRRLPQGDSLR